MKGGRARKGCEWRGSWRRHDRHDGELGGCEERPKLGTSLWLAQPGRTAGKKEQSLEVLIASALAYATITTVLGYSNAQPFAGEPLPPTHHHQGSQATRDSECLSSRAGTGPVPLREVGPLGRVPGPTATTACKDIRDFAY